MKLIRTRQSQSLKLEIISCSCLLPSRSRAAPLALLSLDHFHLGAPHMTAICRYFFSFSSFVFIICSPKSTRSCAMFAIFSAGGVNVKKQTKLIIRPYLLLSATKMASVRQSNGAEPRGDSSAEDARKEKGNKREKLS